MKKYFLQYAMALVAGLAIFASCEEPVQKDPDPIFPETVINKTVAAGESVQINIEPNLAWEVSISGEGSGNYFWIDDDNMKATKVSGKEAGAAVITVVFSEDEEFDVNRVCDVTLTMAGQSKKIATLTRPSLGRTFEIKTAVAGDFDFTDEFAAAEAATLVTFPGMATYSIPVRVVTNYAWSIVLPEWLKVTSLGEDQSAEFTGGQAGTTDFLLTAVLGKDVVKGAEGVVKFIDSNNSAAVEEINVTLPSFENRMEVEINSMSFNREGHLLMASGSYQPVPAVAYVLAVEGFVVRALEFDGTWHAIEYADWVKSETGVYDETAGALQTIDVQITVDENPGKKREADVFIFPASMSNVKVEDICDPNAPECGFKAEYEPYYIGRLVQEGEVPPYLTPISTPELMAEVGTSFTVLAPKGDDNILQWDFAAPVYQKITYTGEWSHEEAKFECSEPFAYVKLYEDTDYPMGFFSKEIAEGADCWIEFTPFGGENKKGVFNMVNVPSSPTHTAAVFFDQNDKVLAAVLVEFASASTGGGNDSPFKVTMGSAEIVKLGMESEVYQILMGNFNVNEVYQVTTGDVNLTLNTTLDIWDVFRINPTTWDDLVDGPMSPAIPNMYFNVPAGSPRTEAIYVFKGENNVNLAALHYIYDPAAGSDAAPFAFVYPDYVNGATLQKATGDILEAIKGEFYGISEDCVYELRYTTPQPSMAMVTVPSMPAFGAAWNNYDGLADYWLTYEPMDDKSILVYMNPDKAQKGQTDYFVFKAADGYTFAAVLVCVYDPAE